jgi:hypothetical protein
MGRTRPAHRDATGFSPRNTQNAREKRICFATHKSERYATFVSDKPTQSEVEFTRQMPQEPQQSTPRDLSQPQAAVADKPVRTWEEWVLCSVEMGALLVLLLFICIAVSILVIWILFGRASKIYDRLTTVMNVLDNDWKICILIFVPLFFRPLRRYLLELKKGPWGMESGAQPQQGQQETQGKYK